MERQYLKLMDMIAAIVGTLDKREMFQSITSHSGRQHARFGAKPSHFAALGDALVPFCASMMPTVGPRSKASLRPTPWPLLCARSWPCAAHGQEGPQMFCAPVLPQVKMCRTEPQDGQEIRAPWPAGCVAARRFSGPSALILPLVAKAERAAG
jgi:Globin